VIIGLFGNVAAFEAADLAGPAQAASSLWGLLAAAGRISESAYKVEIGDLKYQYLVDNSAELD
jgi:hypothetical protein